MRVRLLCIPLIFFFNDTATTEIYTLSLHDALPICSSRPRTTGSAWGSPSATRSSSSTAGPSTWTARKRSEEHTSELQSPCNLVCRLLLEKKKNNKTREPLLHSILPSGWRSIS